MITSRFNWIRRPLLTLCVRQAQAIRPLTIGNSERVADSDVVYHMRDIDEKLVAAWRNVFSAYPGNITVSEGDIFKSAPSVDALVSPANSFGFMDGGIDLVYTRHFGAQLQERLKDVISTEYDGEVLVGQAVIIPTYGNEMAQNVRVRPEYNGGVPIKFLISAPTMRVPLNVSTTPNAYLAFRGIVLAVRRHNSFPTNEKIRSVLVPGLGTAIGRMPQERCAYQMLQAYETFVRGDVNKIKPLGLNDVIFDHIDLIEA